MLIKVTWIVVFSIFAAISAFSVYRDIQADKQNPVDLRNRVVGARLIKDGRSPYFYKWKQEDGIRYYDPNNFDGLKVSNITASPFLHHLMAPLIELPERQISRWWLLLEYIMVAVIIALAFSMAGSPPNKWAVLTAGAIFLLTEAWKLHIMTGQYYLCIPFLAMLFYYTLNKRTHPLWGLAAGAIAISLILIKPYAIFFFIPFLLLIKNYSRKYLLAFVLPLLIFSTWYLLNSQEQFLWKDYRSGIAEQIKLHQGLNPALQKGLPDPNYPLWEGIVKAEILKEEANNPIIKHSENGNVFVITEHLFHIKIPLPVLAILSAIALLVLAALFYWRARGNYPLPAAIIGIMGFCLFMAADLFSPVWRHQYYAIQWMFPVLMAAAYFKPSVKWPYLLIWAGLILNCLNISFIKMEHTIGEYLMFLSLVVLIVNSKFKKLA